MAPPRLQRGLSFASKCDLTVCSDQPPACRNSPRRALHVMKDIIEAIVVKHSSFNEAVIRTPDSNTLITPVYVTALCTPELGLGYSWSGASADPRTVQPHRLIEIQIIDHHLTVGVNQGKSYSYAETLIVSCTGHTEYNIRIIAAIRMKWTR